jgi:hypothetical protein
MSNAALEKLVWVLIYGGLLLASLGVFVARTDPVSGWVIVGVGLTAAAVGAVLIWVRSRRKP